MENVQTVLTWDIPSKPTITPFSKQDKKQTNWRSFFSTTESDLFDLERECDRLRSDLSQLERENQSQMESLKADYERLAKHYYESYVSSYSNEVFHSVNGLDDDSKDDIQEVHGDETAAYLILSTAALIMLTIMFA